MYNIHVIASAARQSSYCKLRRPGLPRHSVSRNDERGFTLVELSIVLVIIGLLIGGILAAQSMIGTAKIQNIIHTINQYDIAVSNFQTKYNGLPGDAISFGGNGDGKILDSTGDKQIFDSEIANFWPNLQQSGFNYQSKIFASTQPAGGFDMNSNNPNSPKISMDKDVGVIVYYFQVVTDTTVTLYNFGNFQSYDFSAVGIADSISGDDATRVLKPSTASAIDTKIDDGNPVTGYIQAGTPGRFNDGFYNGINCNDFDPDNPTQLSTVKYKVDITDITCTFSVELLKSVGQAN